MSQVLEPAESEISDRISSLGELAERVAELHDEKENIEGRRQQRLQKNNAFSEVESSISDAAKTFRVLRRATSLAERLDAHVPQSEIERTLDEYRPRLAAFQDRSYEEFDDVSEISDTRKEFDAFQTALNDHVSTVKENMESVADTELETVRTRETILRIPDIGTEEDASAVKSYKQILSSISSGHIVDPDELESARAEYKTVDIDIETIIEQYDLSEDSGNILLRFLRNETVTLAEVDDGVLDELKRLEEFSERLTIQF